MVNLITCDNCGATVPTSKVKIDIKKKQYICLTCYESSLEKQKPDIKQRVISNRPLKLCGGCGYRYRYDEERNYPKVCPYCSR